MTKMNDENEWWKWIIKINDKYAIAHLCALVSTYFNFFNFMQL